MIVGIDLGTTNSLIACFDGEKAQIIPNRLGEALTPSVVSVDEDGTVYVGRTAQARGGLHPFDTASVFKRSMGTDREYRLGQRTFRAEELSSLVLRSLKEDAEAFLGRPVEEAILSVPAYFNDAQRKATRRAGELAGFRIERIISEPTAAAIAYGICEQGKNGCYLVFDLGGGTLDVSILELYESIMEVHAVAGDNYLGGEDFTNVVQQLFLQKNSLTWDELALPEQFALHRQAELCKLALSDGLMAVMVCTLNGQERSAAITLGEYEQACRPLLARLQKPVERSLKDANLTPADLSGVVLVGGASKSPLVRAFCQKLLGMVPFTGVDPDEAIALGAALEAAMKERNAAVREVILTDVCPFTLGTEVSTFNGTFREDGHYAPIIERNTVIPVSRTERFFTVHDNQKEVHISVLQGENRLAKDNLFLGEMKVAVPPDKAGAQSVDVTYTYDVNALLEVEVLVNSTGQKQRMVIRNGTAALSDAEADARLKELQYLKISPRDQEENKLLLFRGEQLYEESHGAVRQEIDRLLTQFEHILDRRDHLEIERARHALSEALDRLAEME